MNLVTATSSASPESPAADDFKPLNFLRLPGAVDRSPAWLAPFQSRLDWQAWIDFTAGGESVIGDDEDQDRVSAPAKAPAKRSHRTKGSGGGSAVKGKSFLEEAEHAITDHSKQGLLTETSAQQGGGGSVVDALLGRGGRGGGGGQQHYILTLADKLMRGDAEMARLLDVDECALFYPDAPCRSGQKRPPTAIRLSIWKYEFDDSGKTWWKRRLFGGGAQTARVVTMKSRGGAVESVLDVSVGTGTRGPTHQTTKAKPQAATVLQPRQPKYNSFRFRIRLSLFFMMVSWGCLWYCLNCAGSSKSGGGAVQGVAVVGGIAFLLAWLLVLADYF